MNDNRYQRPRARIDDEDNIVVQASAAFNCRRALWYHLTGAEQSNPPNEDAVLRMEMSAALRPVIATRMTAEGWRLSNTSDADPIIALTEAGPGLMVSGRPSGLVIAKPEDEIPDGPVNPSILSIKTRGQGSYRRWQMLGAERSNPEDVAQAALASLGIFGDNHDVVIATLNTAERVWDTEVVPAERASEIGNEAIVWLRALSAHRDEHGLAPDSPPDRDFTSDEFQCRTCPFLSDCDPPGPALDDEDDDEFISDSEAEQALAEYIEMRDLTNEPNKRKTAAGKILTAWLRQNEDIKTKLSGRNITLSPRTNYSYNRKLLNELLEPSLRKKIIKESVSYSARVSG